MGERWGIRRNDDVSLLSSYCDINVNGSPQTTLPGILLHGYCFLRICSTTTNPNSLSSSAVTTTTTSTTDIITTTIIIVIIIMQRCLPEIIITYYEGLNCFTSQINL